MYNYFIYEKKIKKELEEAEKKEKEEKLKHEKISKLKYLMNNRKK